MIYITIILVLSLINIYLFVNIIYKKEEIRKLKEREDWVWFIIELVKMEKLMK